MQEGFVKTLLTGIRRWTNDKFGIVSDVALDMIDQTKESSYYKEGYEAGNNSLEYEPDELNPYDENSLYGSVWKLGYDDGYDKRPMVTTFTFTDGTVATVDCSVIDLSLINNLSGQGYEMNKLKSVDTGYNVTEISAMSFYGLSELSSVVIRSSVNIIGANAFLFNKITTINVPDSVTSIGSGAFSTIPNIIYNGTAEGAPWGNGCVNGYIEGDLVYTDSTKTTLVGCNKQAEGEIIVPNTVTSMRTFVFNNCRSITSVFIPDTVTIDDSNGLGGGCIYMFYNCKSLMYVKLPNTLTDIGIQSFAGCDSLVSLHLPNNLETIGYAAFTYCGSLESINIPDTVTSIGDHAFEDCPSLKSIDIPSTVTSIGSYAFKDCSSLVSVNIDNNCSATIGNSTFENCDSLTYVNLGGVTSIGDHAFEYCDFLTSVDIPNTVVSISNTSFAGIPHISYNGSYSTDSPWGAIYRNGYIDGDLIYADNTKTTLVGCNKQIKGELTIPNTVTIIGERSSIRCVSLTSVIIPNGVTSIGNRAFEYCKSLRSVNIPDTVTTIGVAVFAFCPSLTSLSIPANVSTIGSDAFVGIPNIVYTGSLTDGQNWGALCKNGYIDGDLIYTNDNKTSLVGCNKQAKGDVIVPSSVTSIGTSSFYNCQSITSVIISDGVETIGNDAFRDCESLSSIIIPDTVTSIGGYAFRSCTSLKSVNFGKGITTIGSYAFEGCTSLTSIILPATVTSIASFGFYRCSSLKYVSIQQCNLSDLNLRTFAECNSLTSIVLPDSLTSIGDSVFDECGSLTTVTIGNNVESISYSFTECVSLENIIYNGTTSEWNDITLSSIWKRNAPAKRVYCTNGYVEVD